MALSGSFYTNVGSHWRLQMEWTATQNITANTSTVTAKLYWMALDSSGRVSSSATKSGNIIISGETHSFSGAGLASLSANQKKLLSTFSKTIEHNSAGEGSFYLDGEFNLNVTLGGTSYGTISLTSKSYTLNTIPRKSTLSSSPNFTAGSDFTLTVARASASFTHVMYLDVKDSAGNWQNIKGFTLSSSQTSVNSSFTDSEKLAIFDALNGRASTDVKINLHTYSNGSSLGYNGYDGTVTAPNASTSPTTLDFNIGEEVYIAIARNDSEFTHTIRYYVGGTLIHTKTNIGYGYSWFPTESEINLMYSKVANVTEIEAKIEMDTFYQTEKVRSTYVKTGTARVTNAEPEFSSSVIYYADTNTLSQNVTGDATKIVQGVSTLRVQLPAVSKAVAKYGASIVNYICTVGGKQLTAPYSDQDINFDFGVIDAGVDQSVTIKAVDTRGNSVSIGRSITMIPYTKPTLNGSAKRKNGFDNATSLLANGVISPLNVDGVSKNSIKLVEYRYKKTSDSTSVSTWAVWLGFTATLSGSTYTTTAITLDLDKASSHMVEMRVTDQLSSHKVSMTVGQGVPILFIDALKKTVGIGKFASTALLDVAGTANFDGKVTANGGIDTNYININNLDDTNATRTNIGLRVGADTDRNIKIDSNEILANTNGVPSTLYFQNDGGRVTMFTNVDSYPDLSFENGYIINESMILASLQNGWTNYSGDNGGYTACRYWKDKNGVVHITGLVRYGTTASDTTLFTLPAGYRPRAQEMFHAYTATGGVCRIDVKANGDVTGSNMSSSFVSLAGITFKAEQ
jgi:hypothetical protein